VNAPTCSVYDSGYATADDTPEVVDALARLSAKGCHGEAMRRAGDMLRARPIADTGEYLVVGDDYATRGLHPCLWADKPEMEGAGWIVYVHGPEVVEP
jgi:hypothetical protein